MQQNAHSRTRPVKHYIIGELLSELTQLVGALRRKVNCVLSHAAFIFAALSAGEWQMPTFFLFRRSTGALKLPVSPNSFGGWRKFCFLLVVRLSFVVCFVIMPGLQEVHSTQFANESTQYSSKVVRELH